MIAGMRQDHPQRRYGWLIVSLMASAARSMVWLAVGLVNSAAAVGDDALDDVEADAKLPIAYRVNSARDRNAVTLPSDNYPKQASKKDLLEAKNDFALLARPNVVVRYGKHFSGVRLNVVNGTKKAVRLDACDGRIRIVQEAQDADGDWRAIEYFQKSWCGNSYHTVSLGPKSCWELVAPRYTGPMKTKLRFALEDGETIYSNEFDGAIDPNQFVRKPNVTEPTNADRAEGPPN